MRKCVGRTFQAKGSIRAKILRVINGFTDQTEDSNIHFERETDDQLKAFQ